MPANYCRWLGSAMAATGVVSTASCTVAAMAANYSGWTGAVHNASCTTPPLPNYRRWAGAASAASWTGAAMVARKQLQLNWFGDGCKLGLLDRSGDDCKPSAARTANFC